MVFDTKCVVFRNHCKEQAQEHPFCHKGEENPMIVLWALDQGSMALNVLTLSKILILSEL